jgi:hypothetical protein
LVAIAGSCARGNAKSIPFIAPHLGRRYLPIWDDNAVGLRSAAHVIHRVADNTSEWIPGPWGVLSFPILNAPLRIVWSSVLRRQTPTFPSIVARLGARTAPRNHILIRYYPIHNFRVATIRPIQGVRLRGVLALRSSAERLLNSGWKLRCAEMLASFLISRNSFLLSVHAGQLGRP